MTAAKVEFITASGCSLCRAVRPFLERWAGRLGVAVEELRLDGSPDLEARYATSIPVLRDTGGRVIAEGRWHRASVVMGLARVKARALLIGHRRSAGQ